MRFKKGQTATEYLIILAVVIVIALIVVGVIGGIPSIGGGAKSNALDSYWKAGAKIGVDSVKVLNTSSNNSITITLKNSMPDTIKITNVTLTDSSDSSKTGYNSSSSVTLVSGSTSSFGIIIKDGDLNSGDAYSYDVLIKYKVDGATYTFDGDGNKLEGVVADS